MKQSTSDSKPLSIAICGIRGIPACYGGFETFAEELAERLVIRGHSVRVYGRSHVIEHSEDTYKGASITLLPAIKHKYLETLSHTFLCLIHLLFRRVDVILVCNAANSPLLLVYRVFGLLLGRSPVAVNVDGIERKRGKWNIFGQLWYRLGEQCSVWFADRLISDADIIKRYYKTVYKADSTLIRYGHRAVNETIIEEKCLGESHALLEQELKQRVPDLYSELGIRPNEYFLYVSRIEPENNALRCIRSYMQLNDDIRGRFRLLIVGDAPYSEDYKREMREAAGPEVVFAGYRFDEQYKALQYGAYAYIQATEVGGTHPALVESMGFANCIIANQTPEHVEVMDNVGLFYRKNDEKHLTELMTSVAKEPEIVLEKRKLAFLRASTEFSWEAVTDKYEEFFRSLVSR